MPWRVLFFGEAVVLTAPVTQNWSCPNEWGWLVRISCLRVTWLKWGTAESQGGCAWDSFQNLHNWAGWYIVLPPCQGNNTPLKEYQRLGWWNCFSNEKPIGHGLEAKPRGLSNPGTFPPKKNNTVPPETMFLVRCLFHSFWWRQLRKAKELGALVNLDDISHIDFLAADGLPELVSFRYNPGPSRTGNATWTVGLVMVDFGWE